LDLPDLPEVPVGIGNSDIRIDQNDGVTVTTDVGGVPLELKLDRDGLNVQPADAANKPAPDSR
jgi:penicillin-binding protein 1A